MEASVHYTPGDFTRVKDRVVPRAFDLRMEHEDARPSVVLGFEIRDGVPQCRRAELLSTDDGREVLSSDLRGIKLEDLLESTMAAVAMVSTTSGLAGWEDAPLPDPAARPDLFSAAIRPATGGDDRTQTLMTVRAVRREARRKVTDEVLQDVARVYRENVGNNPTMAVAEFTGRAHRTAALYVKKAREAGYLGLAIKGKAGEQR